MQHGIASGGTVPPILNTLGTANQGGAYIMHAVYARRGSESGHAVTTTAADTHGFLSGHSLDENLKLRHRLYRAYKRKADMKYRVQASITNSHCYAAIKAFRAHGGVTEGNYQVQASRRLPLTNSQRVQEARKQKRAAEERARFG